MTISCKGGKEDEPFEKNKSQNCEYPCHTASAWRCRGHHDSAAVDDLYGFKARI